MSREEAATVYLDVLFGVRGNYAEFSNAAKTLTESDKQSIHGSFFTGAMPEIASEKPKFFLRH